MRTIALLMFLVGWLSLELVESKPWFCRRYQCPDYTTETTTSDYEIRQYSGTKWLSTSVQSTTPWPSKQQKREMFFKLFPYFNGRNSNEDKIKMAVPAAFKIEKKAADDYTITMMLYLAVDNPPASPTANTFIADWPASDVYVKPFKQIKWPSNGDFDTKVEELKDAIADKSSFDPNEYYRVSYNYPFDLRMKQHEIWYKKN